LEAGCVYFTHLPVFVVGIKWENCLLLPFLSLSPSSASPRLTRFDLDLEKPALIKMPFVSGSSSVGRQRRRSPAVRSPSPDSAAETAPPAKRVKRTVEKSRVRTRVCFGLTILKPVFCSLMLAVQLRFTSSPSTPTLDLHPSSDPKALVRQEL